LWRVVDEVSSEKEGLRGETLQQKQSRANKMV